MKLCLGAILFLVPIAGNAKGAEVGADFYPWLFLMLAVLFLLMGAVLWVVFKARNVLRRKSLSGEYQQLDSYLKELDDAEITLLLEVRKSKHQRSQWLKKVNLLVAATLFSASVSAQTTQEAVSFWSQPGILITIVLIFIPLVVGVVFLIYKVNQSINKFNQREKERKVRQLADYLLDTNEEEIESSLLKRKQQFQLSSHQSLAGNLRATDPGGVIQNATATADIRFVASKKKAQWRPQNDSGLSKLVLWYLGTAIFWLVFGTTVGEYLGIKFVAPDIDHQSWLSFGRLRPVHTNAVFWGWSSLALLGIGHYVVSIVSNAPLASVRKGWISLVLINTAVFLGSVCLMAGINNGGGEYREYIWPVMGLFAIALVLTLVNFIQTIARRATHEIYISNWYIVSAVMFTIVIAIIAYWPSWQNGLGETIVQGYYMHQGVGMWFMLFTLGIVYYFLPQQLNKPIYSYSLGILAFWTQIIFYTVIGTHHFVFSSIPWSLQTVAIVGSAGMVIPVIAGTTNFLMTFKGDFKKVADSYTLPFFLVGIVFYFTGSFQGTAEAFRYTNLLWHFTDFTVAHSHITMYGIIAFLLWGSIYALVPRLTGKEPSHPMVGAHFWLAFIGLLLYSVPLMIGGTLKGLMWMDGRQFIDSVSMMAPYWLWRAIGGTMMWISHLLFAFNFYNMVRRSDKSEITSMAFEKIRNISQKEEREMVTN
jgi:cytochrome c oxidase cbb3-type subunit 1